MKIANCYAVFAVATGLMSPGVFASTSGTDGVPAAQAVRYDDLDLTREADAAELYSRIKAAARQACRRELGNAASSSLVSAHDCVEHSMAHAITAVHAPALTSYYRVRTGIPVKPPLSKTSANLAQ